MSNWYVFYVLAGKEQIACNFLNKLYDKEKSIAFIPQVELIFKTSRTVRKRLKPMFPGYVFTESAADGIEFITYVSEIVGFSKCIFYILGKDDLDYMKLSEDEKNFLLEFCDDEFIVEDSVGLIKGDKILVTSGPLKGRESVIKKIDRHKRCAEIELEFLGDLRRNRVALEIIERIV